MSLFEPDSSEHTTARSKAKRVLWLLPLAALLWLVPGGGSSCGELERCRTSVALDLSALDGLADDWEPSATGVALSPDEREVAVVAWSETLQQHRLALFSTATGELRSIVEHDDADLIENPTFSTDGSQLAAATATSVGRFLDSGELTIWDANTWAVDHRVWPWVDDENTPLTEVHYRWADCRDDIGFSNDGVHIECGSLAIHLETGETSFAAEHEVGFNTVPNGKRYAYGRVVYDPEITGGARVLASDAGSAVDVTPIGGHANSNRVELGRKRWRLANVAINGESSLVVVGRAWDGSIFEKLLPRFSRPAGAVSVITIDGKNVDTLDLSVPPAAARFSLSGTTLAVLTTDFELLLFDTA